MKQEHILLIMAAAAVYMLTASKAKAKAGASKTGTMTNAVNAYDGTDIPRVSYDNKSDAYVNGLF